MLGAPTLKCCSQMDFKGTDNNAKDLLTIRKDPWAESKYYLKRPFIEKSIPKNLKGPKRTLPKLTHRNMQCCYR